MLPVQYFNNSHLAILATEEDQNKEKEEEGEDEEGPGKMLPVVKQKILDRLFTLDVTSL